MGSYGLGLQSVIKCNKRFCTVYLGEIVFEQGDVNSPSQKGYVDAELPGFVVLQIPGECLGL